MSSNSSAFNKDPSPRAPGRRAAALILGLVVSIGAAAQPEPSADAGALALGARLYTDGLLSSGMPLTGERAGLAPAVGAAAACVNCHRPSGMGQVEGDVQMPPITGTFLFARRGEQRLTTMDPRISKLFNQAHDPYTDATLMRAIRDGVNSQGRQMSVLMPRYALDDAQLAPLIAYLRQLSAQWSPGVTPTQIHLATVVTPGDHCADSWRR